MTASIRRSVPRRRTVHTAFGRWSALLALVLLAAPAPARAQYTAFLQVHSGTLGNVPGNTTAAGHQGQLQLLAFSMPSSGSITGTVSVEPLSTFFRALTANLPVDVTVSIDRISGGEDDVAYRIHIPVARFRSLVLDAHAGQPFQFDFEVASANGQVQVTGGSAYSKTHPTPPRIPKPEARPDARYQLRAFPFRTPGTGDVSMTDGARRPQLGTVIGSLAWSVQSTGPQPMLGPLKIAVANDHVNEMLVKPSRAGAAVNGTAFQWFVGSQKVLELRVVNGNFWTPAPAGGSASARQSSTSLPPGVYRIDLRVHGIQQLVQISSGGRTTAY